MSSMEGLLRELGGMINRGSYLRDPVDEIDNVIDELLEEDLCKIAELKC